MDTADRGPHVNTIAGPFSGTWNAGGSIFTWTGNATFTRILPGPGANGTFNLTSGSYTVTASGKDATGATGCQQAGTQDVTLTTGNLTVVGQEPARTPPYDYSGWVSGIGPQASVMTVTLSGCPDPASNGTQVQIGLPFSALDTQGNRQSADGLDFTGSSSQSAGGLTIDWNWVLRGTP